MVILAHNGRIEGGFEWLKAEGQQAECIPLGSEHFVATDTYAPRRGFGTSSEQPDSAHCVKPERLDDTLLDHTRFAKLTLSLQSLYFLQSRRR